MSRARPAPGQAVLPFDDPAPSERIAREERAPGPPRPLDPLRFPLSGSRLIEASAGTGKTFTIAALYVRLVLGHGGEAAYARPLTPPEILVVTFTDAATKELRDRIRARLAEAAAAFRADPRTVPERAPGADFLHDLRADYPPEAWPTCARKLQLAAEWMDEAAVSTIHGWCNRMLREHAFDSASLFDQALETDHHELLAEAVRDYWRTYLFPLGAAELAAVLSHWPSPEALQTALVRLLPHVELLGEAAAPAQAIGAARTECERRLATLKAPWGAWVEELQALLDGAVAAKRVDGRKLKKATYDRWLEALRTWAADPLAVAPALSPAACARLTPAGLAEAWKGEDAPAHPALEALAALNGALAALPDGREEVLRHAARWVARRFAAEQARRARMGFDELLTGLEAALSGPNGAHLAALIRAQFPVALIDEFQDTDPVQYRIFDAVYRVGADDPATALVLIGDPKQAIYAFRGADIHTYLLARRAAAGRLYTLAVNYRSVEPMVRAVNRCFGQAEARAGAGAFLFRRGDDHPLPFLAAGARGRAERLVVEDSPAPALTCWWVDDGTVLSRAAYLERLAASAAGEIVRLLALGRAGRAGFASDRFDALRPADVAVLVNNRGEADAVRRALARGGVRSVYLSDRESVFRSAQAGELALWLAACAEPDDERRLRAALATATLGLDWAALDRLTADELAWEARVLQFRGYRQCWRQQGVLPMLRRLMADFEVARRLLARPEGERALTDLLHLAELLQQAAATLDGEHALVRHLAERCAENGGDEEARRLRLESDADLVQVVTVHKSKGLEYPLVFLPFACAFRPVRADDLPLAWHDDEGRPQLALAADAEVLARADRERLGEDLRKLYVALTRARHATWIGVAPVKEWERSALGHLVSGGAALAPGALAAALAEFAGGCEDIAVVPAPEENPGRLPRLDEALALGPARAPRRAVREHWWIASYSALSAAAPGEEAPAPAPEGAESAAQETFVEALGEAPETEAAPGLAGLHRFPRGPHAGTFLHGLLEWAAREGFARVAAAPERLRDLVARRCQARGWSAWIDPLCAWLRDFLATPLALPDGEAGAGVRLDRLGAFQPEMEFWFESRGVGTERLDALVRAATLGGASRPPLLASRVSGMLKGFVDLVFEHEGRYFVADYKSNWLGADDEAYGTAAMRAAVLEKRYDLQYVLYLLALHRLLKARRRDYDYDRHVGGALYLFLRGSHAPSQGLHFERPPRALIEALDALFAGEGAP